MKPAASAARTAEKIADALDEWSFYGSFARREVADACADSLNASVAGRMCEFRAFANGSRFEVRRRLKR